MNLSELFKSYSSEAFRLETLSQYKVPNEWENFQHFLSTGEAIQHDSLKQYISDGRQQVSLGKRHIRARVIPDSETAYFIFETRIGYIPQAQNGFEHNFVNHAQYNSLLDRLNIKSIRHQDFWLFDRSTVFFMNYKADGEYTGNTLMQDEAILSECIRLRDALISDAHPLSYVIDKILSGK